MHRRRPGNCHVTGALLMAERLAGQVAIVTGAGQGIGAAIAERLARDGASVVLVDIDEAHVRAISTRLKDQGLNAIGEVADVTEKARVNELVDKVKADHGSINILVNNAGIIRDGFAVDISEEDWDRVLDVNLKGAFFCCQAVFPVMKAQASGNIVNIASRSWLGNIGQANYSASKGGLVSLTRTLALEFARYQINVNAVAPGLIDTPMTRGMPEKSRERLLKMQPTGKMGTVDDIAAAVSFVAS